jgi:hypothetical protein
MRNVIKSSMYAPIAVFAYNRPTLLRQTINDLKNNYGAIYSHLTVFIDGPRTNKDSLVNEEIVNYISAIEGFRSIHYHSHAQNLGLKKSIMFGVNYMFERHDRLIVLEDDLRTSPYFLAYMNDALELYKDESKVCQISGYSYLERYLAGRSPDSTYFLLGGDCLAWGTWRRAWKVYSDDSRDLYSRIMKHRSLFDFDRYGSYPFSQALRENAYSQRSWAINWLASTYLLEMLTLYPVKSLARHVVDSNEQGTNYKKIKNDPLNVPVSEERNHIKRIDIVVREDVDKSYRRFLRLYKRSFLERLLRLSCRFIRRLV